MFKVGLTGGVGSGKTAVANEFAQLGIPIIDADKIGHQLTCIGQPGFQTIVAHFGDSVVLPSGELDRKQLRELVFTKKDQRLWLDSQLHPLIAAHVLQDLENVKGPYAVVVVPLLLETHMEHYVDRILVVDLPEELQIQRASLRDNVSAELIEYMIKSQFPREERLKFAHDVIDNSGSMDELAAKVQTLHNEYLELGKPRDRHAPTQK